MHSVMDIFLYKILLHMRPKSIFKYTKPSCVFAKKMVFTKLPSFLITSSPTYLILTQPGRLAHTNVFSSTTGPNPGNEWEEGEDAGAELQLKNKASSGVLGRSKKTETYAHFVPLCVSHAAESNICST